MTTEESPKVLTKLHYKALIKSTKEALDRTTSQQDIEFLRRSIDEDTRLMSLAPEAPDGMVEPVYVSVVRHNDQP